MASLLVSLVDLRAYKAYTLVGPSALQLVLDPWLSTHWQPTEYRQSSVKTLFKLQVNIYSKFWIFFAIIICNLQAMYTHVKDKTHFKPPSDFFLIHKQWNKVTKQFAISSLELSKS